MILTIYLIGCVFTYILFKFLYKKIYKDPWGWEEIGYGFLFGILSWLGLIISLIGFLIELGSSDKKPFIKDIKPPKWL